MLGELVSWDETAWHIKQYRRYADEEFVTLSRAEWPTCHVVTAKRNA
jgi:hypothetical protein